VDPRRDLIAETFLARTYELVPDGDESR